MLLLQWRRLLQLIVLGGSSRVDLIYLKDF
jgi:hypothetical protein